MPVTADKVCIGGSALQIKGPCPSPDLCRSPAGGIFITNSACGNSGYELLVSTDHQLGSTLITGDHQLHFRVGRGLEGCCLIEQLSCTGGWGGNSTQCLKGWCRCLTVLPEGHIWNNGFVFSFNSDLWLDKKLKKSWKTNNKIEEFFLLPLKLNF